MSASPAPASASCCSARVESKGRSSRGVYPVLMRLEELETLRDVAEKIDEVELVLGGDNLVKLLASD